LGSEVCRQLAAKGKPVRGLVRITSDPERVDQLRSYGVEIVEGNVCDRPSLDEACQGVRAVISTVSAMPRCYEAELNNLQSVDTDGVANLIAAAQAAGVGHFVYTSFSGNMDLDFPLRNAKRAVERRLKESGLTYTILRPSYFMEAWLSPGPGFDYPSAQARIYGTGEQPISWISFVDVARFAVESLENPAARNTTLELGGPQAISPLEVVKIFEEVGGGSFQVQHVPETVLAEQHETATDPMQQSYVGLMRCYAQGDPIDMHKTLQAFPLELTSVRDYAQRVLAAA
jgi:NADH dehydrogenase